MKDSGKMKNNKKLTKIKDAWGYYYIDKKNMIQGEAFTYDEDKNIDKIHTYKDNILHGKSWSSDPSLFKEHGEYFFYGKSVGFGEEGRKEFEFLSKKDTVKDRFEQNNESILKLFRKKYVL